MYLSGLAGAVRGGDQDLLVRGSLDLEHGARSEIADAIDGSPQDVLGIRDVSVDVNEHRLRTQTDQGTPARLQLAAFAQDHVEPGIRLEHRATFHARRTRHDALEQVRLADEARDERRLGCLVDRGRRALLFDATLVHHDDLV